jgi:hypothetical protein
MTPFTQATFTTSVRARWFKANAPTGTVATVRVTWSGAVLATENHISIYAVTGHDQTLDASGTDTSNDMDTTDPLTTAAITIPANGGFVAAAACATDTTTKTWANATGDLTVDAGTFRHVTATRTTALTATAVTLTGSTNGEDGAMTWIIFTAGPAVVQRRATVTQAQARTVIRSAGKRVPVTQAELVTTTQTRSAVETPKVISLSQGQDVTQLAVGHIRRTLAGLGLLQDISGVAEANLLRSHTGSGGQAQDVTPIMEAHLIRTQTGGGLGQLITAVAEFVSGSGAVTTQKVINVTQAQLVTVRQAVGKIVALAQAQAATMLLAVGKIVPVAQAELVVLFKAPGTRTNVLWGQDVTNLAVGHIRRTQTGTGLGQVITAVANFVSGAGTTQKVISVVQAQAVTVRQAINKLIAVLFGQDVTPVIEAHLIRAQTGIGLGQDVSGVAQGNIVVGQTGFGLGQVVTVRDAIQKVISVVQAQAVTAVRNTTGITQKGINVVQAQAVTVRRAINRILNVLTGQDVTNLAVGHIRRTQAGTGLGQAVTTVGNFVSGANQKIISVAQAQAVTVRQAINKILSVAQAQAVTVRRALNKALSVLTGQDVTNLAVGHIRRTQTGTGLGQIVTAVANFVSGAGTNQKVINVVQAQSVTLYRAVAHRVTVLTGMALSFRLVVDIYGTMGTALFGQNVSGVAHANILVAPQTGTGLGQAVTTVRSFVSGAGQKVVSVVQAQAVTVRRAINRLIAVLFGQDVTPVIAASLTRTQTGSGLGQDVSGVAQAGILVAPQAGTGLGQIVTTARNFVAGGGGTQKIITVVQAQAVTVRRAVKRIVGIVQDYFLYITLEVHVRSTMGAVVSGQDVTPVVEAHIRVSSTGSGLSQAVTTARELVLGGVRKTISVTQAHAITIRRRIGRALAATQGYVLALRLEVNLYTSNPGGGPLFGQSVRVIRSTGHRVIATAAQTVTLLKALGYRVIVASAQAVTVATRATLNKIIQVTRAQAVTVRRAAGRLVSVTTAQLVTVLRAIGHRVVLTLSQTVFPTETFVPGTPDFNKTVSVVTGQTVTVARMLARFKAIVVTLGQALTVRRALGKLVAVLSAQALTLRSAIKHVVSLTAGQAVTVLRLVGHRVLVTSAQAVSTVRARLRAKAVTVTQGEAVTVRRRAGKLIALVMLQTLTLRTAIKHVVTVTAVQAVTVLRFVGHRVLVTSAQAVTALRVSTRLKVITVTSAQAVTALRRAVFQRAITLISWAQAVTVKRSFDRTLAAVNAQVVTVIHGLSRLVLVAQAQAVTVVRFFALIKVVTVAAAQAVTVLRAAGKPIAVVSGQAVTLGKALVKRVAVATAQAVTVLRTIAHRIVVLTAQAVTVVPNYHSFTDVVILVSQSQAVTVLRTLSKTIVVVLGQTVTAVGNFVTNVISAIIRTIYVMFQNREVLVPNRDREIRVLKTDPTIMTAATDREVDVDE